MGTFLRTVPGILCAGALVAAVGVAAVAAIHVHGVTHPEREIPGRVDFESMRLGVEEVRFSSSDGIPLVGWFQPGAPGRGALILCHDFGRHRGSMLNQLIHLHESGYGVLAFDFRGHGESGGTGTTLGVLEKRDVLAAIEFLRARPEVGEAPLAAYGVGMGAHAAVLAAGDRPDLEVLVLDGLYPDVEFELSRRLAAGWKRAGFLPRTLFHLSAGTPREESAARRLPLLRRGDVLMVAPAADAELAGAMQTLYERMPLRRGLERNLILLPATHGSGLYGDELQRYHDRVSEFLAQRLD